MPFLATDRWKKHFAKKKFLKSAFSSGQVSINFRKIFLGAEHNMKSHAHIPNYVMQLHLLYVFDEDDLRACHDNRIRFYSDRLLVTPQDINVSSPQRQEKHEDLAE